MTTKHSRFGGSNASRWMACPGSVHLQMLVREPPAGEAAERGTRIHDYAAQLFSSSVFLTRGISDDEINVSLDYFGAICRFKESMPTLEREWVETEVGAPESIHPEAFGSVDWMAWDAVNATLYIVDLKTGNGIVSPIGNLQLMFYAICAIETFRLAAFTIKLGIYQSVASEEIQWHDVTRDALTQVSYQMKHTAKLASEPGSPLTPGEHCQWCKASSICGARRASFSMIKTPTVTLTDKDVADCYDLIPQIEAWVDTLKERAVALATSGNLPNHTLVDGKRKPLAWKADVSPVAALAAMGLKQDITHKPAELKTPTQIAAAIGKDGEQQLAALAERQAPNKVIVKVAIPVSQTTASLDRDW